jgi:hypothetical protein
MDQSDIDFIKGVIVFVLIAGAGLRAMRIWLGERRRGRPELDGVVDALREENAALQAELGNRMLELEERVDFVERRMVQAPKPEPLPEPRVVTPI